MDILTNYIKKHANYNSFIPEKPNLEVHNIVVIPAIGEPDLIRTIESLWNCTRPSKPIEIIVVINSSENSDPEIIEINLKNNDLIRQWAINYNTDLLKINAIFVPEIPRKDAGAGFARKTGMDEAIRRYIWAGKNNGIISSLDADALVAKNYLVEIEKLFDWDPKCNACSIYFEHPVEGSLFDENVYKVITDYELHLRYYKQMLKYIGFPYYHHTVGSSFAASARSYCRQGGMNKKKAGEDFYFLHKLMPLGNYYELNTTCVYPSPRPSDRVPFGTGATIKEYATNSPKEYLTYHFAAFHPLIKLFSEKELFYKNNEEDIVKQISGYDRVLSEFLESNAFKSAIFEINSNTNNIQSFNKRFFTWFDAFRIIKYLNHAHECFFRKQQVIEATTNFLEISGEIQQTLDTKKLLEIFKTKEKNLIYRNI
jgi:hypothetical protein